MVGIDIFCGIGGLTHGLIRGGIDVVAGVDVDPDCRFAYVANNNAKFIEKDVSSIGGDEIRALWPKGASTLLAGCAPCQPFSTYSRRGRKLRADTKWGLVSHFGRLINESRPDFVTMENVPQLLDHPVFDEFLKSLRDYFIWKGVVDCSQYGVPQTRQRLVVLASRKGQVSLIDPVKNDPTATVREAIGHLRRLEAGDSDPLDGMHTACRLSKLNLRRIKASKPGGTWRDWGQGLIAECHRKKSGATYPSVYGRMEWNALSPTITTQCFGFGNGRFGHPEQNRAITLREAALLQTFPDGYKFLPKGEVPKFSVMGRLIGNAVPVRLGEIIAMSLLRGR
ncbi:MAG: DNA cytosine methyltransferase [Planctomycetaceae bacterium]|nr:DNA cytosine methyltransferase [Planctomycetaceae bacterium]